MQLDPLVTADVSAAVNLTTLHMTNNNISVLNIASNTKLKTLNLNTTSLHQLDLSNNPLLEYFAASYTMISSLDFTNNPKLISVIANNGEFDSMIFGNHPDLQSIKVNNNALTSVNLSSINSLTSLDISYNSLTELDASKNYILNNLLLTGNPLEYLNIKNGHNITQGPLNFINYQDTNIQVICANEDEIAGIVLLNLNYGYSGVVITSYCSFEPGGNNSFITGTVKYDDEADGCDAGDAGVKFTELKISDGTSSNYYYTDINGNFNNAVPQGNYTVTPTFSHQYYTVSPLSFSVNFPPDPSPFVQNICIAPVGNISDLKVTLIPWGQVTPGCYQRYDLYIENQGVNKLSGTMKLNYDGEHVNFHISNPVEDTFTLGEVTWNYANLKPFEKRLYRLGFSFNDEDSPYGIPLYPGDFVTFTVTMPVADDATPEDNTFTLV